MRADADTIASGSSPQYFVNKFGEEIAQGKRQCVLIAGGEVLMSTKKMGAMGKRMKPKDAEEVHALLAQWHDDTGAPPPEMVAVEEPVMAAMGAAAIEAAHGLGAPVATYPIFEQALRRHLGHSLEEHQDHIARICHEMTTVAALPENAEHAWFPEVQSVESIKAPTADNRYIGFPYANTRSAPMNAHCFRTCELLIVGMKYRLRYTKKMNSMLFVDQSAACIMMSAGLARALGIPDEQLVYLHGCGDAYESQTTLYRQSLHRSEATRLAGDRAMAQAAVTPEQIDLAPSPHNAVAFYCQTHTHCTYIFICCVHVVWYR